MTLKSADQLHTEELALLWVGLRGKGAWLVVVHAVLIPCSQPTYNAEGR